MRKGNMTILASVLAIALVAAGVGMGTMAYFSVTKNAGQNAIVASTIDVALTCDFELTDIFPSKELDPITVTFWNNGPIPGYMYSKVTYINNDDSPNPDILTADEFAALIYVKAVTYEHHNKVGGWTGNTKDDLPNWKAGLDTNGDGEVSLYEMKMYDWIPYDPAPAPLIPGDGGRWVITLHMADSLNGHVWGDATKPKEHLKFDVEDNAPQNDGINLTYTVLLASSPIP